MTKIAERYDSIILISKNLFCSLVKPQRNSSKSKASKKIELISERESFKPLATTGANKGRNKLHVTHTYSQVSTLALNKLSTKRCNNTIKISEVENLP